jgi:hypothetical protein
LLGRAADWEAKSADYKRSITVCFIAPLIIRCMNETFIHLA